MNLDQVYDLARSCETPIIGLSYLDNPVTRRDQGIPCWRLQVATCTDYERLQAAWPTTRAEAWLNGDRRRMPGAPLERIHHTCGGTIVHICTGCEEAA